MHLTPLLAAPATPDSSTVDLSVAPRLARDLIVVSNRAPVQHRLEPDGSVVPFRTGGGLVTAVERLVADAHGTWLAHGTRADIRAADSRSRLRVTSPHGPFDVRYQPLQPHVFRGFYEGFSNEALWPLCHAATVRPTFRATDFGCYVQANAQFAQAVVETAVSASPQVLVQDYHLALTPALVRRSLPHARIATFWHVPFPAARIFRTCPWARRLLRGLLGSDIIGVQTADDLRHLLDAAVLLTACEVDLARSVIRHGERRVQVAVIPAGANIPPLGAEPAACMRADLADHGVPSGARLILGVDRLDYTKGLVEKLAAYEALLARRTDLHGSLVLLQVAEPSRQVICSYQEVAEQVRAAGLHINDRFGGPGWQPVRLVERHCSADEVRRLYRSADVCWVNSVDDGMNLVAKEFVATRHDERGALVLSEFAGAAHQLTDALLVNPFAIERTARVVERALSMSDSEQRRRMRAMRCHVLRQDSCWWAQTLLRTLADATAPASLTRADVGAPALMTAPA